MVQTDPEGLNLTNISANTELLPQNAGVELNNGAVVVDEFQRTNVPSIWALGDVTDKIQLTPVALMEGMAFAATCFGGQEKKPDYTHIASAVCFCAC